MTLQILLDGTVVLLLVATLTLGLHLQRRLHGLHSDGGPIAGLVAALGEAVNRAETVLAELKRVTVEHAGRVDEDLREAQRLRDDLAILSGRADRAADRLAGLIAEVRELDTAACGAAPRAMGKEAAAKPRGAGSLSGDRHGLERTLRSLR